MIVHGKAAAKKSLPNDLSGLAPIYASLARSLIPEFMRVKGMSQQEAEKAVLEKLLKDAQELAVGLDELDEELLKRRRVGGRKGE